MRVVHLVVPRDYLKALLEGTQKNFSFIEQGVGEPLQIFVYAGGAAPKKRFVKNPKREPGDD